MRDARCKPCVRVGVTKKDFHRFVGGSERGYHVANVANTSERVMSADRSGYRRFDGRGARAADKATVPACETAASNNAIADRDDAAEGGPATDDAFEWTESRYDTRVVLDPTDVVGRGQLPEGAFNEVNVQIILK